MRKPTEKGPRTKKVTLKDLEAKKNPKGGALSIPIQQVDTFTQQESRVFSMTSNVMKAVQDGSSSIVNNAR